MPSYQLQLASRPNNLGEREVAIRVTIRRGLQPRVRTGLYIDPKRLGKNKIILPRTQTPEYYRLKEITAKLDDLTRILLDVAATPNATREDLDRAAENYLNPQAATTSSEAFFARWSEFLARHPLSEHRVRTYKVVIRVLHRYEIYTRLTDPDYTLDLDRFDEHDLDAFVDFYRREHTLPDSVTRLFGDYPPDLRPQHPTHRARPRGNNAVADCLTKIASFFNWCARQGYTTNRPFERYEGSRTERYGTPYYLTIEERDRIADCDLTSRPGLLVHRDIFVVQCYVGCRVSDLLRLKKSNIVDGALEYVAEKTKHDRASTIRVPLHPRAAAIIAKYADSDTDNLLPRVTSQRYNIAIKEICRLAGIDRVVTIINPTTGQDERRPIHEIASSHLARRTFVGNLYKRVKDPNLVGALSGHKEGSRAFVRYRDIDEDMRREVIDLLGSPP